jgi:IS30 family transposase
MRVAKRRMQHLPPCLRRSITFDHGKEFAEHRTLTRRRCLMSIPRQPA